MMIPAGAGCGQHTGYRQVLQPKRALGHEFRQNPLYRA